MFKRFNNLHLSVLIGIVSIFSLLLIQQYVVAQTWVDPEGLPGETQDNTFVVNPITDDLDIGTYDRSIVGDNVKLDGSGANANALIVQGNRKICLGGTTVDKCLSNWPTVSGGVTTLGGTVNYIPKFKTGSSIEDSIMSQIVDTTTYDPSYPSPATDTIKIGSVSAGGLTSQLKIETLSTNGGHPLLSLRNNWGGSDMMHITDRGSGDSINILKGNTAGDNLGNGLYILNIGAGPSLYIDDSGTTQYNDTTPFVLDKSGNLGIGTATPSHQLHIRTASGNAEMDIQSGGTAGDNSHWGIYHSNPTTGVAGTQNNLIFWKNSANRIMFTPDGKIYMGTAGAAPSVCDINGNNCLSGGTNYWTEDASGNLSRPESNVYLVANAQTLPAAATGNSNRLVWYPLVGAIRAGIVQGTQWDNSNIGFGSVAFGKNNIANGDYSVIAGGRGNWARSVGSFIGGGGDIDGSDAANRNYTYGYAAAIGAGVRNQATGNYSGVFSGQANNATGLHAVLGGGYQNQAVGEKSSVLGGTDNRANGQFAIAAGGSTNRAVGIASTVSGGIANEANNQGSAVGGGGWNIVNPSYAVISGGKLNVIDGQYGVIAGGLESRIDTGGIYGVIAGGAYNGVAGAYSVVPGGVANYASSTYSFAAGHNTQLTSTADNVFAWGVSNSPVSISRANSFLIFPTTPPGINAPRVGIGTPNPNATLEVSSAVENAEIDIRTSTSGTHWGIYQSGSSGPLKFWNVNDIFTLSSKGAGVNSNSADGNNYYMQLDFDKAATPPAGDCAASSDAGRMILGEDAGTGARLWICYFDVSGGAWNYVNLVD